MRAEATVGVGKSDQGEAPPTCFRCAAVMREQAAERSPAAAVERESVYPDERLPAVCRAAEDEIVVRIRRAEGMQECVGGAPRDC